jgi:hypothetical protein
MEAERAIPATTPRAGRAPLLLCGLVLAIAIALRVANFGVADRSPDEVLWTRFGAGVAREGPGWVTRLVHDFNRGADVDYPWQHRVAYVCLVGLAMRASGDTTVRAAEALSTVASVAAVAMTGLVAYQFLDPWIAPIAMLFLAVSPLDLALARRAWQDDVLSLATLLMVWAFLRHAARGGRASAAAFWALSIPTLLVKESAAIPFGLGVLGIALLAWRRSRRWKPALLALAGGAAAALVASGVLVAVSGGWGELRRTLALSGEAMAPDEYLRRYQMGGIGYYPTGLAILQPVPFLLGTLGAVLALLRPRRLASLAARPAAGRTLAALGALALGFGAVAFGYFSKNMRFLSPIYAPVGLLAASVAWDAIAHLRARAPRRVALAGTIAIAVALAGSAALDARRFDHYFNELQIQDLATPWFTRANTHSP